MSNTKILLCKSAVLSHTGACRLWLFLLIFCLISVSGVDQSYSAADGVMELTFLDSADSVMAQKTSEDPVKLLSKLTKKDD